MAIVLRARLSKMRGRDHIRLDGSDRIGLCAIDVCLSGRVNDNVWRVSREEFGNLVAAVKRS